MIQTCGSLDQEECKNCTNERDQGIKSVNDPALIHDYVFLHSKVLQSIWPVLHPGLSLHKLHNAPHLRLRQALHLLPLHQPPTPIE